jgi:hypothetical protein
MTSKYTTAELERMFPELEDVELTLDRISESFVAPEYARAAFALMRDMILRTDDLANLGQTTVVTAPSDLDDVVMTVSKWWFLSFHMAEADALEGGDDVEETNPEDYDEVLEREAHEHHATESNGSDEITEEVEATFYQVGTFLLDSTIIPHETIFDREDLDCYAYDYPYDRIEAERFYWARMVWEPEDLENVDLRNAVHSALLFVLENHREEAPFAEYHDSDFERLVTDEDLCERAIAAADFGDVIVVGPESSE